MRIIDYESKYKNDFRDLNIKWISKDFVVEEVDYLVLNNPEEQILKGGGCILLAEENGKIIGTCALMNEGHGIYELTKMTVDENHRGKHIGLKLGLAALERARSLNAKKVILFSNTVHNGNAINLYRKLGFNDVPLGEAIWVRANIKMEMNIAH